MRRRLTIVLPCLLLAALIAGHTAAWFAGSRLLDRGFATWVARQRAAGWQVDAGTPVRGGWPLAASLRIPDMAIAAGPPEAPGRVSWHGELVVLSLTATRPDHLGIDLVGAQSVRIAPDPDRPFTADRLRLDVPLSRTARTQTAGLEVRNLRSADLAIGLLTGQVVAAGEPTATLAAEAIDLPPRRTWAFGQHISSVAMDATIHGELPPPGPLPAMAAAWRGAGGAVDLTHFALGWGPLGVAATGRLGLDEHLQPAGTADLHVIGFAKALEALAAEHVISRDAARAATAVLTLLSRAPPDGGTPEVAVPLTLRDRTVEMGRTPLVRVPEVVWPAP
jgi:hypothetical protein